MGNDHGIDLGSLTMKPLGGKNIDAALDKADQYRALNEPDEAESICRDVLTEEPANQRGLRTLGLALTDMFDTAWTRYFDEAMKVFEKLTSPYEVAYYTGVGWERCAKAELAHGQANNAAHSFEMALSLFEKAAELGPKDSPDPVLRWNRCVRAIALHPEVARAQKGAHRHEFQHGD